MYDCIPGSRQRERDCLISYQRAQRLVDRSCEVFLATIMTTTEQARPELAHIPVVRDFTDIFFDEEPGLPPVREVEFAIDLAPSTTPICRVPYQMAPLELRELKA